MIDHHLIVSYDSSRLHLHVSFDSGGHVSSAVSISQSRAKHVTLTAT